MLVCYDGSAHADSAIAAAARLFPRAEADVLCVAGYDWSVVAAPGGAASPIVPAYGMDGGVGEAFLTATREQAESIAEAGAREARRLGLTAHAAVELTRSSIWHELVRRAESGGYEVVVIGAHGHSAIRTAVLGGASAGVAAHCTVPVLVVHAPDEPSVVVTEREIAEDLHLTGTAG